MSSRRSFSSIIEVANNFHREGSKKKKFSRPFYIGDKAVGLIEPGVLSQLHRYPDVFELVHTDGTNDTRSREFAGNERNDVRIENIELVRLCSAFQTFEERSEKLAEVLQDMREKDYFVSLRGWRDECYTVYDKFSEPPLMKMERAATCLFGVKQYGVHINGYVNHSARGPCMWIARRSKTKQTFPSKLDQMAAGGLASGDSVLECAIKECQEEASVPDELTTRLKPAGTVSYFYEDERGLFPECEFVMDLEVPEDFCPVNLDGEVESFQLVTIEEVKELITSEEFKFSSAVVVLDFLIRHGFLQPDNEPNYTFLIEQIHQTLL